MNPHWLQNPRTIAKRKATWSRIHTSGGCSFASERLEYDPLPDYLMRLPGARDQAAGTRRGGNIESFLCVADARDRTGY